MGLRGEGTYLHCLGREYVLDRPFCLLFRLLFQWPLGSLPESSDEVYYLEACELCDGARKDHWMKRRILSWNQGSVIPLTRANESNLPIVADDGTTGKRYWIVMVMNANHSL